MTRVFNSWTPQPLPVYTKLDEKDSSIHQYQASHISSCTNAQRPRSPLATSSKNLVPLDWHFHLQVLQLGSTVKLSEESIRTILSRWEAIINQNNYLAVHKNLLCLQKERDCNRSDSLSLKTKSWAITNRESLGADEFVKFQVHTCLVCQLVNWKSVYFSQHMSCLSTCQLKKCFLFSTHVMFVQLSTLQLKKKEKCVLSLTNVFFVI